MLGTISSPRILVVEDFDAMRRLICLALQKEGKFQLTQASDGLEAVQKAEEQQPDLILLDIGLPGLNGIEAARRIRTVSRNSKIIFLTQESSPEVVQEALSLGAQGYVLKFDVERELLLAVDAVLEGKRFVSGGVRAGGISNNAGSIQAAGHFPSEGLSTSKQKRETRRVHEVASYRSDASFVHDYIRFIEAALELGNPVIVIASESHRKVLLRRLETRGRDMTAAIQGGSYVSLDASETLSKFMVDDWPDADRLLKVADDLIAKAVKAGTATHSFRVAICGECAPTLWAQGKAEAAIEVEHLWDEIARNYDVDILCGYLTGDYNNPLFKRICAEHSAAYSI